MFPDLIWPDFQPMRSDGRLEEILQKLEDSGIYIAENFFAATFIDSIRKFAEQHQLADDFNDSLNGKKQNEVANYEIRSDKIFWIESFDGPALALGQWLDSLASELKNYFRIPIDQIESHFSIYPPGSHYARHIDNGKSHGQRDHSRFFTFIIYLNPNWSAHDGGELVI